MRQAFAEQDAGTALIPARDQDRRLVRPRIAQQAIALPSHAGQTGQIEQAQLQLAAQVG